MRALNVSEPLLQRRPAGAAVPLIAWQQRMWKGTRESADRVSVLGMCPVLQRVQGPLDRVLLEHSIEAVVKRHEALRTRIEVVGGSARQLVDPPRPYRLEVLDLQPFNADRREGAARRLAQEFIDQKVDLSVGPLFAARLLRLSEEEHVMLLAIDHMVADATSCAILDRDLWTFYNQALRTDPARLPPLPVQFPDYAAWQYRTHDSWLKQHEAHWRERFEGAPRIEFPTDLDPVQTAQPSTAMLHIPFGRALSAELRTLAQRERTLLPLLVLTIYALTIARWCGQRDFVLAFLSHGRHRRELQNVIGLIAHFVHLRIQMSAQETFRDLLSRITRELHGAYLHHDLGRVPDVVAECAAQLYFNWISSPWTSRSALCPHAGPDTATDALHVEPFPASARPNRPLGADPFTALVCAETAEGIEIDLCYAADSFRPSTIERLGETLKHLAQEAVHDARLTIG